VSYILQAQCSHASDVLRPYSALDYAWDEPGLPHTLLLELPGSRSLGAFDLDKASSHVPIHMNRAGPVYMMSPLDT